MYLLVIHKFMCELRHYTHSQGFSIDSYLIELDKFPQNKVGKVIWVGLYLHTIQA
jgi:hypothetical protein